jgi:hypothetical protein
MAAMLGTAAVTWVWTVRAPQERYSVDAEFEILPPAFVAPFVEADRDSQPSQFGHRIAGDISMQFGRK